MLKLRKPVQFSKIEYDHLVDLMGKGLSGPDMWKKQDEMTLSIKNHICIWTLRHQNCRCAYCEKILSTGEVQIEHIVDKGKHREFTFHPRNLIVSCSSCNSSAIKGTKPVLVGNKQNRYKSNQFKIVHPYFDNPDDHIKFQDEDRIYFDKARCSRKGLDTIDFFEWDSYSSLLTRTKVALTRHLNVEKTRLILEISTYKKK